MASPAGAANPHARASLCASCVHRRLVESLRGSVFLLCRSDDVPHKYPPQPVLRCHAYEVASRG